MPKSHLFVIDPLPSLNLALDSSLRLMAALARLGHAIYVAEPRQLGWRRDDGTGHALAQSMTFTDGEATKFTAGPVERRLLTTFSAIHMRKDPPYDIDYVAATWLLETGAPKTKIYNAPSALRGMNEKLAGFSFGPEDTNGGLVSADPEELLKYAEDEANGDAILKPLTLFGGRGVLHLEIKKGDQQSRQTARTLLIQETEEGRHLRQIQAFDRRIYDGEVRAFTAFGEPVAWCLKKPAHGNFLANTRAGATLLPFNPPADVKARVMRVAQKLQESGVVFVGFDLIGGMVSEINITSPRLLTAPGDPVDHYQHMAKLVDRDLAGV